MSMFGLLFDAVAADVILSWKFVFVHGAKVLACGLISMDSNEPTLTDYCGY